MKKIYLFIYLLISYNVSAQLISNPIPLDIEYEDGCVKSIMDNNNDLILYGYYNDYISINSNSHENEGIYLTKIDVNGNFIWSKVITKDFLGIAKVITDNENNLICFFSAQGNINFDEEIDAAEFNSIHPDFPDMFIVKYSSTGSFIWGMQFHSTNDPPLYSDIGGLGIDLNNNIYFSSDAEFSIYETNNIGINGNNQEPVYSDVLGTRFFVILNENGELLNMTDEFTYANVLSNENHTYTLSGSNITDSVFVSKRDENFNVIWNKNITPSSGFVTVGEWSTHPSNLIYKNNNLYVQGAYGGSVSFENTNSNYMLNGGEAGIFIAKYDNNNGNISSVIHFSEVGDGCFFSQFSVDNDNNIYAIGSSSNIDSLDIDPSDNNLIIPQRTMFIAKYNEIGNLIESDVFSYQDGSNPMFFNGVFAYDNNLAVVGSYRGQPLNGLPTSLDKTKLFITQSNTNTNLEEININLSITPNPAKNEIKIINDSPFNSIKIFDLNGYCLFDKELLFPMYEKTIMIEQLKEGMYIISLEFKDKVLNKKIIKVY